MTTRHAEAWVRDYIKAWSTDDPADIAALFSEDAEYFWSAVREPVVGREAIVEWWRSVGDSKAEWSHQFEVIAVQEDTAVIRGDTVYAATDTEPEKAYNNVWVVRFGPDGRARQFTEWWTKHKARSATEQ